MEIGDLVKNVNGQQIQDLEDFIAVVNDFKESYEREIKRNGTMVKEKVTDSS